jgi:hypothetical protein
MRRFLPQGLQGAGERLLEGLRSRSIQVPVAEGTLADQVARVEDATVRNLRLSIREGPRLELSGEKKKGIWIPFSATFAPHPPPSEETGQAVDLHLEHAEPFFARQLLLRALTEVSDLEVSPEQERVRVRLDQLVARQDWARAVPEAVRRRIRVTGVDSDSQGRLLITFSWAG